MKALYFGSDGSVFVVADIQSSAASYKTAFPWTGWEWNIVPVVEAAETLQVQERVRAWEDKTLAGKEEHPIRQGVTAAVFCAPPTAAL